MANLNKEEWKSIKGYETLYEVSNLGNVRSLPKYRCKISKILKPVVKHDGYLVVSLCKDNKIRQYLIHRLVANEFIMNTNNKPFINHIDNTRTNNEVSNLEWCTQNENVQHSVKQKRHGFGEKNNSAKLTEKQVKEIRGSSKLQVDLSSMYNISQQVISKIKNYKLWPHVI